MNKILMFSLLALFSSFSAMAFKDPLFDFSEGRELRIARMDALRTKMEKRKSQLSDRYAPRCPDAKPTSQQWNNLTQAMDKFVAHSRFGKQRKIQEIRDNIAKAMEAEYDAWKAESSELESYWEFMAKHYPREELCDELRTEQLLAYKQHQVHTKIFERLNALLDRTEARLMGRPTSSDTPQYGYVVLAETGLLKGGLDSFGRYTDKVTVKSGGDSSENDTNKNYLFKFERKPCQPCQMSIGYYVEGFCIGAKPEGSRLGEMEVLHIKIDSSRRDSPHFDLDNGVFFHASIAGVDAFEDA